MGQELAVIEDRSHDGPFMASLSNDHRRFVLELVELGAGKKATTKAAVAAGFSPLHGYKLMRDQRILDALQEEASKKLVGASLLGVKRLIEIAQDKDHRDSYKAVVRLTELNGFTTEKKITVEHISHDGKEIVKDIRKLAQELNVDAEALIRATGFIEDGEFTEVPDGG